MDRPHRDRSPETVPDLSVVIPTYCEAANLPRLVWRLCLALNAAELNAEILIVDDDSPDRTAEICRGLAQAFPLRLIVRRGERGLATAVLRGLREARGRALVVMDADLSHPPEAVPRLAAALDAGANFAIGSRYVAGGSVDANWGRFRRLNSKAATLLARGLTPARDPLAGFFALRRETFERACGLAPMGYKIGLELLVKSGAQSVIETPIAFRDRTHGSSKLTLRQQWLYLRHLGRLYRFQLRHGGRLRTRGDRPRNAPAETSAAPRASSTTAGNRSFAHGPELGEAVAAAFAATASGAEMISGGSGRASSDWGRAEPAGKTGGSLHSAAVRGSVQPRSEGSTRVSGGGAPSGPGDRASPGEDRESVWDAPPPG